MGARLARAAYTLLMRAALPLVFARYAWCARREPLYGAHWGERLGFARGGQQSGRLWLHAVSLGETRAAAALIDALRQQQPGLRLLLTHGTATGRDAGRALLREGDAQAWLPLDTPGATRRFLRAHRPVLGVVMETEVWPNLLHQAQRAGVPMVLANARLSQRSLDKGLRMAVLMRPAVATFTHVLAQTADDAQRLRQIGAAPVDVLGNLKFDMTPDAAQTALGRQWRSAAGRAVVLAASTREGEELPLLQAWAALPALRPLLLLVPRHPQRFDEVAALLSNAGLSFVRRSSWATRVSAQAIAADVWLGDSLGEMALYYGAADVALLGGSFAPLGGQNLIEAAACGCPLLMGPHTYNFQEAAERALAAGAAERVLNIEAGVARAVAVAGDPGRTAWVQRALAFAAQHGGAAARMAQAVVAALATGL